jgi:hypothetical protein
MSQLTRRTYFAENDCMYQAPHQACPRYHYPLEQRKPCKAQCHKPASMAGNPQPAQLYGDAVGYDGGTGAYYYHHAQPYPLSALTIPPHQGPHLNNPWY